MLNMDDAILKALEAQKQEMVNHRKETREDLKDLRSILSQMASSITSLANTAAAGEVRHANHQKQFTDILHRLDNHGSRITGIEQNRELENRIEVLENAKSFMVGSWRTVIVVAGLIAVTIGAGFQLISYLRASWL